MTDLESRIRQAVGELIEASPPPPPLPPLSSGPVGQPRRARRAALVGIVGAVTIVVVILAVQLDRHRSTTVKMGPPAEASGGHLAGSFPSVTSLATLEHGNFDAHRWDLEVEVNGPGPVFRQSSDPTKEAVPPMELPGLCVGVNFAGHQVAACTNPVTDPALTWTAVSAPGPDGIGQDGTGIVYGMTTPEVDSIQVSYPGQLQPVTTRTIADRYIPGIRFFAVVTAMQTQNLNTATVEALDGHGQVISTSKTPLNPAAGNQAAYLRNGTFAIWPINQITRFPTAQAVVQDFASKALGIHDSTFAIRPDASLTAVSYAKIPLPASGTELDAQVVERPDGAYQILTLSPPTVTISGVVYQQDTLTPELDDATGKVDLTFRLVPGATSGQLSYVTADGLVSRPLTPAELRTGYSTAPGQPIGAILLVLKNPQGQTLG